MTRILIAADIEPWPAIEGAFAHSGHKIGHKVVAEAVALVDRAPELAGPRLHRHSDAVAQTRRKEPLVLALRREGEHEGAVGVRSPWSIYRPLAGIAARSDRNKHAAAIF